MLRPFKALAVTSHCLKRAVHVLRRANLKVPIDCMQWTDHCASFGLSTELLQLKVQSHSRSLRSSTDKLLFQIPHGKTKVNSRGPMLLLLLPPKLWNSLPIDIRNTSSLNVFKSKLKTYLFN